jgi:hypothetical protein
MKFKVFLCVILLSQAPKLLAQELSFPPLQGYKIVTDYPVYTPDNLWDLIDGAAESAGAHSP